MVVGWAPWWIGQTERTTFLTVGGPPGTVVLELLPLPFEQLGLPLPCGP